MDGATRNGGMLLKIAALLVLLRRAEAVATSFVAATAEAAGATADDLPWLDDSPENGSSPLDAAWLAVRFRLLAALLDLCRAAGRSGDKSGSTAGNRASTSAPHPATLHPILLLVFPARRTLPVHDTS